MSFFKHLEGVFSRKIALTKDIYTLFKLEAKLAGLNIQPLLVTFSFLIAFAIALCLSLMFLVGDLLFIFTKQPLSAILGVLFMNLVAILFILRNLKNRLEQMSFSRTRACLKTSQERSESESTEEGAVDVNCRIGNKN